MGVTLAAGASLAWWRSVLADGSSYDDLAKLAAEVRPGSEGLVFLPYLFGERSPHLDPQARGAFVGLSARHSKGHLTRAVMEGVVFSLRQSLDIVRELGVPIEEIRAIGGGAKSPVWLQLQADIYGVPVKKMTVDEGPAYGAALLAGVAAGVFTDVADACRSVKVSHVVEPNPQVVHVYEDVYAAYRELYAPLKPWMHQLVKLSSEA